MIRVLVVDDHPVVRGGIVGLLSRESDIDVVAEASSGHDALELAGAHELDVVLMDLRMPHMDGVEATRRMLQGVAPPRVLVFTTYEDDDQILAAIEAGASGYLVKAAPAEELVAGVRAVAAGQTVLSPSVAAHLVAVQREGASRGGRVRLTPRETEVLRLVAEGLGNAVIAERLFIGESTVKTHLLHVYEKLDAPTRTRAVTRAMELGLL